MCATIIVVEVDEYLVVSDEAAVDARVWEDLIWHRPVIKVKHLIYFNCRPLNILLAPLLDVEDS